ncbi:MAG TPA: CdaR family protein [Candidatus Solibacter sp.]|nr:CdaR family protein [Candidatus Solibacter sp.]
MKRLMRNWQLKVLGLFIAGTTWSVVAYAGNPPTAESFKGIVLEHGQPPSGLVLIREPAPVTVTVRGLQSSLSNFHKESLHAAIDLAGAHKGSNLLPVHVRVDSPDQSVLFAAVDPANAEVVLDQLATVQRKVDVRVHGTPNSCCLAAAGVASPDTVTLQGPAQQLETAIAYVDVSVDGQGTAVQQTIQVRLQGPDGKALTQVSSQPTQVIVRDDITAVKRDKPAGMNPITTGQIAAGYYIADVTVSPVVLQVEADPGILATIQLIDTEPISLAGATNDIVATVSLRPPAGVMVLTRGPFTVHFVIKQNPLVKPSPSPTPAPSPSP